MTSPTFGSEMNGRKSLLFFFFALTFFHSESSVGRHCHVTPGKSQDMARDDHIFGDTLADGANSSSGSGRYAGEAFPGLDVFISDFLRPFFGSLTLVEIRSESDCEAETKNRSGHAFSPKNRISSGDENLAALVLSLSHRDLLVFQAVQQN